VEVQILDAKGDLVRKLIAQGRPGLNRIGWDLHYDAPHEILLRTLPPEDPHIFYSDRFYEKDERPITHWGMYGMPTPMAVPGNYTAKLTIDGQTYTQPVTILADPSSPGSPADIEASVKLQLRIAADIDKTSDMVNHIEWMRKQLAVVENMLDSEKKEAPLAEAAHKADQQMQDVEYELMSKPLAASDDKTYISAWKIYYNLMWLSAEIGPGAGDVAGGTDYAPTDVELQLTNDLEQKLAKAEGDYHTLMTQQVPAFNRTLASHNIAPISDAGSSQ
jgi:hypothetical protein